MKVQHATAPAARGRIIRKGGAGAATIRRAPTVAAPLRTPPLPSQRAPRTIPTRPRRDVLVTFLAIPLLFLGSAGFMWARPDGKVDDTQSTKSSRVPHARFNDIGAEMADRFSMKVSGVVLEPQRVRKLPEVKDTGGAPSNGGRSLTEVSSPASSTEPPPPRFEALQRQVHRILKKHGKPVQNGKDLAAEIVREALAQDYDPVFVAAVIKSESAFNSLARSNKGAQGLMQIMPKTGAWLADQQSIPRRKLTDPGHNLKLGISYLKQLEGEYGGNRVLTLIAYNWGPGHVASASAGGRRVPGEVMQYAVKILNDYRRWTSELRSSIG